MRLIRFPLASILCSWRQDSRGARDVILFLAMLRALSRGLPARPDKQLIWFPSRFSSFMWSPSRPSIAVNLLYDKSRICVWRSIFVSLSFSWCVPSTDRLAARSDYYCSLYKVAIGEHWWRLTCKYWRLCKPDIFVILFELSIRHSKNLWCRSSPISNIWFPDKSAIASIDPTALRPSGQALSSEHFFGAKAKQSFKQLFLHTR